MRGRVEARAERCIAWSVRDAGRRRKRDIYPLRVILRLVRALFNRMMPCGKGWCVRSPRESGFKALYSSREWSRDDDVQEVRKFLLER